MRTKLSILLLVLGACDRNDEPSNRAPTIDLTSHRNGERVQEGYEIRFEATVTDGNDALTDLAVSWSVGDQELCPTAAPDGDGLSICDAVLQLGDTEIEALVTDPSGAMAWETLTIEVMETATPSASIVSPDGTATYYSNFEVALSGLVSDGEDAAEDLNAWWESNIDGVLDTTTITKRAN